MHSQVEAKGTQHKDNFKTC